MSFARHTIHEISVVVFHEIFTKLINSLISQVHIQYIHIGLIRFLVPISTKAHEPILMQEDAQRINRGDADLHTQVKLQPFDQERVHELLLTHKPCLLRVLDVLHTSTQNNTLSLA